MNLSDLEKTIRKSILKLLEDSRPLPSSCGSNRKQQNLEKRKAPLNKIKKRERTLVLILTEKCNLRCVYCLRDTKRESGEVPFPALKRIILSAHRFGIKEFSITGGEMFVYPHWREMIKLIGLLGGTVFIESNGQDIKEDDVVFLKNTLKGKIFKVMISLDSDKAEIHDKFRGVGAYEKAVSAIKLLRKYDIKVKTNVLFTSMNLMDEKEILDYLNFVKTLGVGEVSFGEVVALGRAKNSRFLLSENQRRQINQILEKHNYFNDDKTIEVNSKLFKTKDGVSPCHRLGGEISVSPNGLHPCVFNIGTIKLGDFQDFETLLYSDFLSSFHWADYAAQSCFKKQVIFGCSKCTQYLPQWLSLVKNKITVYSHEKD